MQQVALAGTFRYRPRMFRLAFCLVVLTVIPACGPPAPKPVKHAKKPAPDHAADDLVEQARDDVKDGATSTRPIRRT